MKKLLAFVTALSVFFTVQDAFAEFSTGVMQDFIHARDSKGVVLRYDYRPWRLGVQAMKWEYSESGQPNSSIGLDYNVGSGRLDVNVGGAYLAEIDDINGTRLNFSLSIAYNISRFVRAQYTHFSNGHNKNNEGWNFIALMISF